MPTRLGRPVPTPNSPVPTNSGIVEAPRAARRIANADVLTQPLIVRVTHHVLARLRRDARAARREARVRVCPSSHFSMFLSFYLNVSHREIIASQSSL
jgi:hypothetical protein